jgi:hypothetical protein
MWSPSQREVFLMSKVTPTARHSAVAAGTVGLAALGAVAGAVTAHAAAMPAGLPGLPGGLPLSTNALQAVQDAVAHNHGQIAGMPLQGIPVVGELSQVLNSGGSLADSPLGALGGHPGIRSRPLSQPAVTPAVPAATPAAAPVAAPPPAVQVPAAQQSKAMPTPAAQGSTPEGLSSLTGNLPLIGGLAGGGLLGGLPLGGLTGGLGSIGG